jgi:hypothetical protein
MPDGEAAGPAPSRTRRIKWRPTLRALHRDFGYLAVGLTFVYALSGLAVNHIASGTRTSSTTSAITSSTVRCPTTNARLPRP